jgi:cyanate permease
MPEHPYRWLVLAGCWLNYFIFGLSITGLAPLVVLIMPELFISASAMGAVLGAWQFVYIFVAIPLGLVLHRFGPGRMLVLGAAIIAASGFLRAEATSHLALLAAVALFGLGGPILSAGIPQTIGRWFTGPERGLAMGIYITGPAIAGIIAYSSTHAVLLPWLEGDWRAVLRVWAWFAVFASGAWFAIWLGGRRLLAGQGNFPSSPEAGAGSGLAAARQMLTDRTVVLLLAVAIGSFTIDHGLRNWLPEIIRAQGHSPAAAGFLATIPVVMGVVSALVFPRLAVPARRALILRILFALSAAGLVLLHGWTPWLLVAGLVLAGLASGAMMTVSLLTLIEQRVVGPGRAGLAGGLFFSVAEIGGVGGPVLIGVVRDATGGFGPALWLLAGVACGLFATTYAIFRRSFPR